MELSKPPSGAAPFPIEFGLAVLRRPGNPSQPLYERQDLGRRSAFVREIGDVEPVAGPPAYGAYGRVFQDALQPGSASASADHDGYSWRPDSRRAVVFVTSRPPSAAEMRSAGGEGVELSEGLNRYLAGHEGEPAGVRLGLYVVTPRADDRRARTWARWTESTGGGMIHPEVYDRTTLLRAIDDALTDAPVGTARELAAEYQPRLVLAKGENWRPIDIDQLLNPPAKSNPDKVCDRRPEGGTDCKPVPSAAALLRDQDEFIDFDQGVREPSSVRMRGASTRMYFHIRRHHGLLHIGYWWYFPVNVSPVQEARTCLPGLTLKDLTCYDHEGDWEGVTVTLEPRSALVTPPGDPYDPASFEPSAWKGESVSYDAHGRSIRWDWPRLDGADVVVNGSHPLVFAAWGSHASYPLPCPGSCKQALALKPGIPEGPFNGRPDKDAVECAESCLRRLPSLRRQDPGSPVERLEDPVLWNAFPGRWGAAVCLDIALVCSQSDGPPTPSRQDRYRTPWRASEPSKAARKKFEQTARRP